MRSMAIVANAAHTVGLKAHVVPASALLKAMSNPARLVVLRQLAEGEKSVGELEGAVSLSQSGLSQHLALLRREAIVVTRRQGQTILYRLSSEDAAAVMCALHAIFCGGTGKRASKAAPKINGARRRRPYPS